MEKTLKASFKGVEFEYLSKTNESGRRGQLHEYPNQDKAYFEDMGKKAENYIFEAFLIGDDYEKKRDELKSALLSGSGLLIHPDFGEIEATCTTFQISEKTTEKRLATFNLTFVETGKKALPEEIINYKDKILIDAEALEENAKTNFLNNFSIGSVNEIAKSLASDTNEYFNNASKLVKSLNLNESTYSIDTLTKVLNEADGTADDVLGIFGTPDIIISRVSNLMNVYNSFTDKMGSLKSLKKSTDGYKNNEIDTSSKIGKSKEKAGTEIATLINKTSIANEAKIISEIDANSPDEIEELISDFNERIDKLILNTDAMDFLSLTTLNNLKATVNKYKIDEIRRLPEIKDYDLKENSSCLTVAYELYEDLDRSDEIIKRNNIKHSGFIKKGKIKVLSK